MESKDRVVIGMSCRVPGARDTADYWRNCTWTALEDGCCDPFRFTGAIGIFAGSAINHHYSRIIANTKLVSAVDPVCHPLQ